MFWCVSVQLRQFGCHTNVGGKRVELVQKFMPRSSIGIFCNERTRSTPLEPKHLFWCISYHLVTFGTVWLPYETRCKIFRCYFVARTFALVRLIFHRDSKGNQTVLIAPKWSEKHQNMSLGSNGVDRVRSFRKILTRFRGTNFCNSSVRFAPCFVRQPNSPKCNQMVRNAPKQEFRFNGVDRVRTFRKIPMRLRGTNFCTSSAHFPPRFVRQPNSPNCTETHQNMSLGSNGWIGCVHCETFRWDFVA